MSLKCVDVSMPTFHAVLYICELCTNSMSMSKIKQKISLGSYQTFSCFSKVIGCNRV